MCVLASEEYINPEYSHVTPMRELDMLKARNCVRHMRCAVFFL